MFKLTFSKYTILYVILLMPFFKPIGPAYYTNFNIIYQIWKLISFTFIILILIQTYRQKIISSKNYFGFLGLILFGIIYILNGLRFNTSITDILNNFLTNITLFVLIITCMYGKKRKSFFNALDFIFTFLIVLQIISVFYIRNIHTIFEPIENDYVYFLGTDNYSAFATLPMIGILFFIAQFSSEEVRKIKNYILLLGLWIINFYTMSITALLCFSIFTLFLILFRYWNILLKIFSVKKILIFMAVFLILVIHFNIQNYFSHFLANYLGKGEYGITLNSRTYIWNGAWGLIKTYPIIGMGKLNEQIVLSYTLYGASHAHNILLELLMKSGIIGTFGFLYFILFPIKFNRKIMLLYKTKILIVTLISFLILSLMDTYPLTQYQYILYALLYWWHDYTNTKKVEKNEKIRYCCS